MDNMKRFVSMLLCFVMLLGFLPAGIITADAAETPLDAAVIFSDLHIGTSYTNETTKATKLKNVLNVIKTNVGTVSSVNSAGDMFSSNEGTVTSDTDKLTGYIREVFPSVPVNYVWTDHDRNASAISKKSSLVEYDNYYVYLLSMGDLSSNDRYRTGFAYSETDNTDRVSAGFTATVPQAIENFQTAVANLDQSKPLFIVGHQPLFDNRNDNAWAEDWVAAINEVAAEMDVTYFCGHNHNYEFENDATDSNDYYFASGSEMPVPKRSDWGFDYNEGSQSNTDLGSTDVTIQFTHISAGYMDPATGANNSNTRKGTAVAAVIYDDHITYTAYDDSGVYNNSNDKMDLNVSVERKNSATSAPETSEPVEDETTHITVAAPGVTAVSVNVVEEPEYDHEVYTAYASYDITPVGYTQGDEATVSVPAPAGFDVNRPVLVLDAGEVIATTNIVKGMISFTTNHFSVYDVAQTAAEDVLLGNYIKVTPTPVDDVTTYGTNWTTIKEYVAGTPAATYHQYVLADGTKGVTGGNAYLIVNTDADGTGYALLNNNGTVGKQTVTITDGTITLEDGQEVGVEWLFSGATSGTVSNQGSYLFPEQSALSLYTSATNHSITISNQGSGAYRLYSTETESFIISWTRYNWVYYYNNNWTYGSGTSLYGVGTVYLYEKGEDVVVGGTEEVLGLYAYLSGNLSVEVDNGTSAENALAAVKNAITVKYDTDTDHDTGVLDADDDAEGLTWTLDTNYDGTVGGDYAVVIAYNGKTLGVAEVVVDTVDAYYGAMGQTSYTVDMGLTAGEAMSIVKAGTTIYSATDASGSNAKAIDDSAVTWEWDDTFNGNSRGPYTVTIKHGTQTLGTVEVEVNVSYGDEDEESAPVEVGGCNTVTKTKTVYVLSSGNPSGKVLIATRNNAGSVNLVANNGGSLSNTATTVINGDWDNDGDNEYYIELTDAQATNSVWTVGGSYTFQNQGEYLRYNNGLTISGTSATWNYYNGTYLRQRRSSNSNTYYYLRYNNGWTTTTSSNSATSIYFYVPQSVTYEEEVCSIITYTMRASDLEHNLVRDNNTAKLDYSLLADGVDASILPGDDGAYAFNVFNDKNGIIESISDDGTITFTGNAGSAQVRVSYTWTDDEGIVREVYKYVTVTATAPNNYPEYPNEGAVKVGKTGTGIDFQSSGIAQVEISASGVPMKRGVDIIVMLDMSSSMDKCISCGNDTGIYSNKTDSCSCSNPVTRVDELRTAMQNLKDTLVAAPGADDIKIAVADFNGYYQDSNFPNSPYEIDTGDRTQDKSGLTNKSYARVYTGDALDETAFVTPAELDITAYFTKPSSGELTNSGTNYDYAFDAIYQLGHAIQEANGENQRDLFVIFMSDGAPNQYNYYHTTGGSSGSTDWNYWLTGRIGDGDDEQTFAETVYTNHTYYYDAATGNQHRMANAVKGNPDVLYEIIRKNQSSRTDAVTDILVELDSDDANYGKENMYKLPGLGATMYSVAFYVTNDGPITEESAKHVLSQIPSSPEMYIEAEDSGALSNAFSNIATDILYAAYNARYVDQMGENYDLQMKPLVDLNGNPLGVDNKIEIVEYEIYTKAEADKIAEGTAGDDVTVSMIGARKIGTDGNPIYKVIETVTFNADGTEAYSSLIDVNKDGTFGSTGDNILGSDGVIYAKNFLYNTNTSGSVSVDGVDIPTGVDENNLTTGSTTELPAETFYWKMGTVKTTELAMRYFVYLEGSMEGLREAGSYPTNEYANLYYDNFVGNPCHKETVSPVLPWKEANVSYAFYLVDEAGNIVVNQTTGETGSFANKIAVTNPVVYSTIKLNADEEIDSAKVAASGVLPEGYTLYDAIYGVDGAIVEGATYTVKVNSNGTGEWHITGPKPDATTYVTQFNPANGADYNNTEDVSEAYDYSHTVVWFAVVWKIQALPDTVVVDYGLPVDVSVMTNDMFGEHGTLAGVGALDAEGINMDGHTITNALSAEPYDAEYGTAAINAATGKVRYSLNTMEMNGYDKFAYSVNYTGSVNAGYYYETVTVIPATTIYFEDNFESVTFSSYTWDNAANGWGTFVPKDVDGDGEIDASLWSPEGESIEGVQGEDRPGQYSLTDANNIYGYDGVNLGMSTYSMGSAMKATVDYDNSAHAQFTFWGTGFDIISMTSNMTGTILVDVEKNVDGSWEKFDGFAVDTYYGYKQVSGDADEDGTIEDGELVWVVDPDADGSIYQVPVIKMVDKDYAQYRVTIRAIYERIFDHVKDGATYDFHLDAIRIYDPADDGASDGDEDTTIEDAYKADGEGWPSYFELRNGLIKADTFDGIANEILDENAKITGLVFIDGDGEIGNLQIADYISYGPNNEVYLAPGQSVSFLLNAPSNVANIHIGMSLAFGTEASYSIYNIARMDIADSTVKTGTKYNEKSYKLNTTTDMYYNLTGWKNDIIVITNNGAGTIAISNIKSTYTSDPRRNTDVEVPETPATASEEESTPDSRFTYLYMTAAAAEVVVDTLNGKVPENVLPETFEPKLFHVKLNKSEIKVGQKVLVNVTTSSDVEYVLVNGEKVTTYTEGRAGNRTWKTMVTGTEPGKMDVEVVCVNGYGISSESVVKMVNVKRGGFFGMIDKILN